MLSADFNNQFQAAQNQAKLGPGVQDFTSVLPVSNHVASKMKL